MKKWDNEIDNMAIEFVYCALAHVRQACLHTPLG